MSMLTLNRSEYASYKARKKAAGQSYLSKSAWQAKAENMRKAREARSKGAQKVTTAVQAVAAVEVKQGFVRRDRVVSVMGEKGNSVYVSFDLADKDDFKQAHSFVLHRTPQIVQTYFSKVRGEDRCKVIVPKAKLSKLLSVLAADNFSV